MDFSAVIRSRLEQLGFEQRELASAAQVTESYISQLLTRKKTPPATDRTGIYDKKEQFLKLPGGELAKLADQQRLEELKKNWQIRRRPCLRRFGSWFCASATRTNRSRCALFSRGRPSVSSNVW